MFGRSFRLARAAVRLQAARPVAARLVQGAVQAVVRGRRQAPALVLVQVQALAPVLVLVQAPVQALALVLVQALIAA